MSDKVGLTRTERRRLHKLRAADSRYVEAHTRVLCSGCGALLGLRRFGDRLAEFDFRHLYWWTQVKGQLKFKEYEDIDGAQFEWYTIDRGKHRYVAGSPVEVPFTADPDSPQGRILPYKASYHITEPANGRLEGSSAGGTLLFNHWFNPRANDDPVGLICPKCEARTVVRREIVPAFEHEEALVLLLRLEYKASLAPQHES